MNWRDLPPVAENVPPRDKASQTLLARQAVCPRSAYLYLRHEGGVGSHAMHRGSAFHQFAKEAVLQLVERDERSLPWEVGKDIVAQIVAEHPEWVIPPDDMDALRLAAFHWCDCVVIDPGSVVAVEKLFELPVGGMRVRGKVDLAYAVEGGVAVRDWKTALYLPTQAEFDGSVQVPLYALLVGEGYPVREEPCETCGGSGETVWFTGSPDAPTLRVPPGEAPPRDPDRTRLSADDCEDCGGSGRVETPEPRIGERFGMFDLSEEYPRLQPWDEAGRKVLAYRQRWLTRQELVDQRLYVEGLVAKLEHGLETGEWPAVPDPEGHCKTCVARHECPIPPLLRGDVEEPITTPERAEDVALHLDFEKKRMGALKAELKAWAEANGPVPSGSGHEYGFSDIEKEEWITGKKIGRPDSKAAREQMEAAIYRAVNYGESFDYREFRKVTHSAQFDRRKVKPGGDGE